MKRIIGIIAVLAFVFFTGYDAMASHVSGGNIKYTYIGPGSTPGTHKYKIRLGIIRDCNGIPYNSANQRLTAVCKPGNTPVRYFTANKVNYIPKPGERPANNGNRDLSDICRRKTSRCAGTGNPGGYEEVIYEATIDLPTCNYWEIYLNQSICCRNGMGNATGGTFSPMTRLNNLTFPKNSSPKFADEVKPMPSVCTGQNVFYGIGTVDPDGDSLRFHPARARVSATNTNVTYVNYTGSYTYQVPITNFKLDSASGLISFNTNATGRFLVAFEVIEYERCTGREKGRTHREVQFDVRQCSNKVPRDISGISNLKGNAKKLGKFTLEVCEGEVITWHDTIHDQDLLDTLRFASNVDSVLPSVNWKVIRIPGKRSTAVVEFNWRARIIEGQYHTFFLSFDDDRCDFPGNGFSVFNLFVRPAASAGPDQFICLGDTAHLDALGGKSFEWHLISGDPLINGVNWFPDTTANDTNRTVRFIPTQTTKLWVEVDTLRDQCGNLTVANCFTTDTIVINVLDSFSIKTVPDFFLCNPGKGQLDVTPSQPFKYKYKWEPSSFLTSDTTKNPNFSGVKFPTTFGVTVTSDSGCVREGEVNVNVTEPFPTNMKAYASDTLVCLQKQIKLWVDKGSIDYGSCDTVKYKCQGNFKDYTLGSGGTSNPTNQTTFANSYGTFNLSQKSQYLYLASDLKAMGMEAGPINSIAWELTRLYNNTSSPINNFTIKISCTKLTNLPNSGFVSGLRTVFGPRSIFPNVGWNAHTFDQQYVWDGVSNLIVEVCFENTSVGFGHHTQTFDNKSYRAATSYSTRSTWQAPACPSTTTSAGFPNRYLPRTRFNVCSGMRSSLFKFDWDPKSNGGFVGPTNLDTAIAGVNLSTSGKYYVYVEDSLYGVCKDTLEVDVSVVSSYDVKPDSLPPQCFKNGFIQFKSGTPPNITNPGGKWSGVGIVNDSLGVWDPIKSGKGKFWVVYSVTGDACAATDSTQIEIVGLPDPTLLSPDSLCGIYGGGGIPDTLRHRLIPKNPGGWFTGVGVDSVLNGNGDMVYWIDGTKFNPTTGNPDTAVVKYTMFEGCLHDSTFKIPVVAPWDHTFLGTLDGGVPQSTITFCMTADPDTLAVAGPNPVWTYVQDTSAMIDRNRGIIDPRIVGQGQVDNVFGTINVANHGFCGTDTNIAVVFVLPPEIEIMPDPIAYCPEYIEQNKTKVDTMKFRIPKPGSGKKLNPNGFDPANENLVWYGDASQTGWNNAFRDYSENYWSVNTFTMAPNVARFRLQQLKNGANKFKYRFAWKYRDNHKYNRLCYREDSVDVYKMPEVDVPLSEERLFCDQDTVSGFYTKPKSGYGSEYEVLWFTDSTQSHFDSLEVQDTVYYNPAFDNSVSDPNNTFEPKALYMRYRHKASGCMSYEKGSKYGVAPYKVYSMPKPTFSSNPEDLTSQFAPSTVTYTNTTEYKGHELVYQWKYFAGRTANDETIPEDRKSKEYKKGDGSNLDEVKVNYDEAVTKASPTDPDPRIISLWAINPDAPNCKDSTYLHFEIGTEVEFVWPNVFTPGKDGYNDWWFIIPPEGTTAYGCEGQECFDPSLGEVGIKDWFDRNLEMFEGYIYDRWGRKVYEITKENPIWKGETKSGGQVTDGVYMYSIRYKSKGSASEERRQEGTITLIREK